LKEGPHESALLEEERVDVSSMKCRSLGSWIVGLACCGLAFCQTPTGQLGSQPVTKASPVTRQIRPDHDREEPSRAAAPVEEIRAVLAKDPGLVIELERLVEKEAISKGQLVEDSDLTEQAILDRLPCNRYTPGSEIRVLVANRESEFRTGKAARPNPKGTRTAAGAA
jgi:hypothetical protein